MPYQTINEFNASEGAGQIFVAAAAASPGLFPMILFGFWIVAFMGTYFAQKSLTSQANVLASFAAASYFVTILAFVLSLIPGILAVDAVLVPLLVSIISTVALVLSSRSN